MAKLKAVLKRVPGVSAAYRKLRRAGNAIRSLNSPFLRMFPAGHFYSPLADVREIAAKRRELFRRDVTTCAGVDLNVERQMVVLNELAGFYHELPFSPGPKDGLRYYFENNMYSYGDGIVLYGMLRRLQPTKIIEVGSGFSSANMLDTNDRFLDGKVQFTFVEPYPARLKARLTASDTERCRILEVPVQDVALNEFDVLDEDDILFIDSSHVVKIGSDVGHLLWKVLPRLKPGVVVHIHDIVWPFEYPDDWVLDGNGWNEAYFLRSFLQYNSAFAIEYFNSYMAAVHRAAVEDRMPLCLPRSGGSIWIRKIA